MGLCSGLWSLPARSLGSHGAARQKRKKPLTQSVMSKVIDLWALKPGLEACLEEVILKMSLQSQVIQAEEVERGRKEGISGRRCNLQKDTGVQTRTDHKK